MAVCPVIAIIDRVTFVVYLKSIRNCTFLTTEPRHCNVIVFRIIDDFNELVGMLKGAVVARNIYSDTYYNTF
jgi:hypothetical protein